MRPGSKLTSEMKKPPQSHNKTRMTSSVLTQFSSRRINVRKSNIHGRGVFALQPLRTGELICEYKGEHITSDEALLRHPRDPSQPNHTFFFDLGDGTVIDGSVGGNSARWINHSCKPNCEAKYQRGRIFIRTTRPIDAGEELAIDYALVVKERATQQLRQQYACHCGSLNCRGTMLDERRMRTANPLRTSRKSMDLRNPTAPLPVTQAIIRIFERPGPDSLVISWREAGRCCYSEQRWELTKASEAGTCALSGRAYSSGDRVFRPVGYPAPTNQHARIARKSIDEVASTIDSTAGEVI